MWCRSLAGCRTIAMGLLVAVLALVPMAANAETRELRIGAQFGLGYLPLYVARDAGLFEKHMKAQGVEPMPVRIVNFTGGPQIQDGLLSQTLDIGAGGVTVLLITRDKTRAAGDQEMRGLTALSSSGKSATAPPQAWKPTFGSGASSSVNATSLAWANANKAVSSITTMSRSCGSASASGRMRSTYS